MLYTADKENNMHIVYMICPTYTASGNAHSRTQISGIDLQQKWKILPFPLFSSDFPLLRALVI